MAIRDFEEHQFQEILKKYLTPSGTIKTPERLFGRQKLLTQIQRAINSTGRQVMIYGDRGVGKTSLAYTSAYLLNDSASEPIYVVCGEDDSFADIVLAIGRRSQETSANFETEGNQGGKSVNILGVGGSIQHKQRTKTEFTKPNSINEALEVIRYIGSAHKGRRIVIVDEMERLTSKEQRGKFAEFIKNVPELGEDVKFIFCGIGSTVDELIGAHPSAGRVLETIELPKLNHSDMWEILQSVTNPIGVTIDNEMLVRISQLSDGFPHYVHLVGESMLWSAFDDVEKISHLKKSHFMDGVRGALEKAEATLRQQYDRATKKTKHTGDYEEALWALADTTSDKRQLTEIFESSYRRIFRNSKDRSVLSKEQLNQRLQALRKETHGNVVNGFGAGWFGFRENILRGYVRLKAEHEGVILGRTIV